MVAVLRFLAWVVANIGRWGSRVAKQISRISAWIKNNWKRVLDWINKAVSFATIVQWILSILGIS